jgi:hypothetical protein
MVTQIIQLRYNDLKSLEHELMKLFPNGDFAVDVCWNLSVEKVGVTLSCIFPRCRFRWGSLS